MDLRAAVTGVLNHFAASRPKGRQAGYSDLQLLNTKLLWLFQLAEKLVDENPSIRKLVATGIASFINGQFAMEGKAVLSVVFVGSFKRCALLWKLLLKELKVSNYPQRLLLKLEYCQRFCIETFNISPLDTKRTLVSENATSITFALDLSVAVLQGRPIVCHFVFLTQLEEQ